MFSIQNLLFTSLEVPVVLNEALFLFLCALDPFLLDPFLLRRGWVETVGAADFRLRRGQVETVRAADTVSRAEGVLLGGGRVGGRDSERVSERVSRRVGGGIGSGVGRVGGCVGSRVVELVLLAVALPGG